MDHGHTVTEARDGAQAAEFAARQNFDVALLDIDGISGVEAANLLRKMSGKRSTLPIVAIVSDALDQRIIADRSLGIMHHLVKPFSAHELLATVDRVAHPHSIRSADPDACVHAPAKIGIAFDDVQQSLNVLTRKVELLLAALRHLDGTASDTAAGELAREVASLAKLFGLGPLADAAGRFADAAVLNSPVAGDLAHALESAAHSCLPELRELAVSDTI